MNSGYKDIFSVFALHVLNLGPHTHHTYMHYSTEPLPQISGNQERLKA